MNTPKIKYPAIAAEIQAMIARDQEMREKNDEDPEFWDDTVDPENMFRLKQIVSAIGWPTVSKVGEQASHGAALLVRHADRYLVFQRHCFGLMKKEVPPEICLPDVAYLEDRICVNLKYPQIYGTQFMKVKGKQVPRPLLVTAFVNDRRKFMGLDTLEENIERMNKKSPQEQKI